MGNVDYKERLSHYAHNHIDDIADEDLVNEAIASLENYFGYIEEKELMNHSRIYAISYLALRHIKDNEKLNRT